MNLELNLNLDNYPIKVLLSKEAKLKGISLEKLISQILEEYVEAESSNQ